ncbi:very short patch repair endonuclease [Adhaeribacter soli]|uniref:Very short patch repair endonuclease n=1 Tax=Adhaeribacter soli TaxID=2607655 RepID=A0A5N1IHQ6_9BACT|nr:DNA mismatch endonuclease Vsr [Adhaeribacter soli]KAA9325172.1 DNA mismatch endonuclease Vsr [Adhaeribacter soli]
MADKHTPAQRSYNMSRIRSKDTKPEMIVRKFLHTHGFRYRLHVKNLPGRPDIVLKKHRTVIFVHGCFWHCHEGCRYFVMPKSKQEYWRPKIERNLQRDIYAIWQLQELKWKVIIIWECELKQNNYESTLSRLIDKINN